MSETLTNVAGGLIAQKGLSAILNYSLDYSQDLGAGASLQVSTWSEATGGLTLSGGGFTDTQTTITIAGGVVETWYVLKNVATDSSGLVHQAEINVYITDLATMGAGAAISPFPSIPGAIAAIRRDRLTTMVATYLPAGTILEDAYLLEKLVSATAYIQRRLRVHLVPTEMLPNTALQSEIDALVAAQSIVELEPAYDYDPAMFVGNTWGRHETRQRPIIALHSMQFVYPTPNSTLFQIPTDWFRVDYKYGIIHLLPIQNSLMLPLNAFILSALGGGRHVPGFLQIRYSTGLSNCARDYPDILDLVKKQAALSIAEDLYLPSSRSESTSADGLTQSTSIGFRIDDYTKLIDTKVNAIRDSLVGVRGFTV